MATPKKELYVEYDLEYLEQKLQELKDYLDKRPFSEIKDRFAYKQMAKGGSLPMIVATEEAQRKDLTQGLKDYAELLRTINVFREIEGKKEIKSRGDLGLSPMETGEV